METNFQGQAITAEESPLPSKDLMVYSDQIYMLFA